MNHKASSMETWNAIAYGKSSRPVWFPRKRLWRLGFRCWGVEKSSAPGSWGASPRTCAPPAAPLAGFLCFFLVARRFAVRRPSPARAAAGNQATQRTRSTAFPDLRQPSETAASFSGTRWASVGLMPPARPHAGVAVLRQPLDSACTPHRALSSAKESPLTRILIRIKTLFFYFVLFLRMWAARNVKLSKQI